MALNQYFHDFQRLFSQIFHFPLKLPCKLLLQKENPQNLINPHFMHLRLLVLFLFFQSANSFGQTPQQLNTVKRHFEAFNTHDYKKMHSCYSGLMKLVFSKNRMESINELIYAMKGDVEVRAIKPLSEKSVSVTLVYSRDTTEMEGVSYSFNKKGKIAGLRMRGESFKVKKSNGTPLPTNFSKRMDSLLALKQRAAGFHGCVSVMDQGKLVYNGCVGETARGNGIKITPSTMFELASCSKQFTAYAILMLLERGKLNIDDPITKWLPDLPYKDVTIRHLLNHIGGLADYAEVMEKKWDKKKIANNADVLNFFASNKPKPYFKAGSQYAYSNTGYVMLACIIEKASAQSYDDFMKNEIFVPLGMSRTTIYHSRRAGQNIDNYALGYVYNDSLKKFILPDSLAEYDYVYWLDGITGDGCVNSCLIDLVKWENNLRSEKLLTAKTLQLAFTANKIKNESTHYGFGWEVMDDERYEPVVMHSGSWPGYVNIMVHYTNQSRSITILTSSEYFNVARYAIKIATMME